jgi:hypothetical protein
MFFGEQLDLQQRRSSSSSSLLDCRVGGTVRPVE